MLSTIRTNDVLNFGACFLAQLTPLMRCLRLGRQVMLKHIEEQVGSIPDPWHRLPTGPSPASPTPGTYSSVPAANDDA